jgi:archaellum component FlaC|nr:MAG TPA: hypothetical protein [Crassvirales sp.]
MENLIDEKFYEKIDSVTQDSLMSIGVVYNNLVSLIQNLDKAVQDKNSEIEKLKKLIKDFEKESLEYKKELKMYQDNELAYDRTIDNLKKEIKKLKDLNPIVNENIKSNLGELDKNYKDFCEQYAQWELEGLGKGFRVENKSFDQVLKEWDKLDKEGITTEKTSKQTYSPKVNLNQLDGSLLGMRPIYKGFAELMNRTFGQEYFTFEELEKMVNDYYDYVYKSEENK